MGITIHFGGKIVSKQKLGELLAFTAYYCDENGFFYTFLEDTGQDLVKMKDGMVCEEGCSTSGIIFQPHQDSESVMLFFDENLELHTSCKTQFAGAEGHLIVIEFLEHIERFFESFWVDDEGDYWQSRDGFLLQDKLDLVSQLLNGVEKSLREQKEEDKWRYN